MTDKDKLSREDLRADRAAPPRRGTLHRILVLVAVLAVVLGAVLAAAYLDLSNFDSLRRALSYDKADAAGENTYDYDNDRTNRFARHHARRPHRRGLRRRRHDALYPR